MFRALKIAAIVLVVSGIVNIAWAGVIINYDARTPYYTGQGALGEGGTTWNNGSSTWSTGLTDLKDSYGNATVVDVARSGTSNGNGSVATSYTNNLTSSYFYTTNTNGMTVTISSLDNSKVYDLYLYGCQDFSGQGNGTFPRGSTFVVGGVSKQTIGVDTNCAGGTFYLGSTHVVYNSVAPTAGSIVITIKPGAVDGIGFFNGFQLKEVPEPSTIALLAAGLVGLAAYAWRKRK